MPRTTKLRAVLTAGIVAIGVGLFAGLLSTTASAATASAAGRCAGAGVSPATNPAKAKRAILCLINRERARHGLRRLRTDARLAAAARRHSNDMVQRRFFAHTAPGNVTFAERIKRQRYLAGARGWTVGENLAWGSGSLAKPARIMRGWMNSPGHRANILLPRFREIGIGIARGVPVGGGHAGATYTTDFGAR